jgi:hypothetical protein
MIIVDGINYKLDFVREGDDLGRYKEGIVDIQIVDRMNHRVFNGMIIRINYQGLEKWLGIDRDIDINKDHHGKLKVVGFDGW